MTENPVVQPADKGVSLVTTCGSRQSLTKKTKSELIEMVLAAQTQQDERLQNAENELTRVYAALDTIEESFAIFDADDRFVFVNSAYRDVNSQVAQSFVKGARFESHLRALLEEKMVPSAVGCEAKWLVQRMHQHLHPDGPVEQIRSDGTVLKFTEIELRDGSRVLMAENISDQRRLGQALVASEITRNLLTTAFDEISEGIALFDEDDRLVQANKSWWQMNADIVGITKPGTSFEDHVWNCIHAGLVPAAAGREEEWVAERLAHHRNPQKSFEVHRSDGRVNLVREQLLSNGHRILIILNITQQKRLQSRLEEAIESINEAFVLFDAEGKLLLANSKFREFFAPIKHLIVPGTHFETMFRESVRCGWHSDRAGNDEAFIQQRLKDFFKAKGTRELKLSDGRWILSTERKTASGEIVAIRTDITELKHREEEATHAEQMLLDAIESISEGFILFDAEGRLMMCNSKYKDYYPLVEDILVPGLKIEELVEQTIKRKAISIDSADRDGWIQNRIRQFKTGQGTHQQLLSDGRWVQVVERSTKSGGIVGIRTEITDIVNAERESRGALEFAERANRAKSEFLGNMSHELRTPLNAIIGFSSVISNQLYGPVNNAFYLDYAGDIQRSGEHLLTLIGDLLDISRIEAGEVLIDKVRLDIVNTVRESLRMIERQCHEKNITLDSDLARNLPALFADKRHLRQILINILTNAVKFTPRHGFIIITANRESQSHVLIEITDSGVGIAPENLDLVLEPFGQVADSLTRNHDGVGLGLPIVKSLIELHKGELRLSSEVGKGTTVALLMPVYDEAN